GNVFGAGALPQALRPQANRWTAGRPATARRVWFAAPSSPRCVPPGSGSWTTKRAGSEKIARSTRVVVSASIDRWNIAVRFAGVRWTRPSAASADGATVAALAVHIADELAQSRR